jgi:hypothetical protein
MSGTYDPVFTAAEVTDNVNNFPVQWGMMNEMGMFPFAGVTTPYVAIEEESMTLSLVPTRDWCGPSNLNRTGKRKQIIMAVPHTPIEDMVTGCDVMGSYAAANPLELQTAADEVNMRLAQMRAKLEITLEYRKVSSLFGNILDADGTTVIENTYTAFGIAPTTVNFTLSNPAFDIRAAVYAVKRAIEANHVGDVMDGVRALISPADMNALIAHPNAEKFFSNCCGLDNAKDWRAGFPLHGITFAEYQAQATNPFTGSQLSFVPTATGVAYPTGTRQSHRTYVAPADFNDTVNRRASQLFYASMEPRQHNRGFDLHMQMNALPLWIRPRSIVRIVFN